MSLTGKFYDYTTMSLTDDFDRLNSVVHYSNNIKITFFIVLIIFNNKIIMYMVRSTDGI